MTTTLVFAVAAWMLVLPFALLAWEMARAGNSNWRTVFAVLALVLATGGGLGLYSQIGAWALVDGMVDHLVVRFDPVMLDLGRIDLLGLGINLQVRWYAMAYIIGMIGGVYWMITLAARPPVLVTPDALWDLFTWVVIGVIAGGRLGWAFFYDVDKVLADPSVVLRIWEGGMAFHGGLLGVVVAICLFARRRGLHPFVLSDLVACAVPIGLFLGRIANFINGELWGRRDPDLPWAVVFPNAVNPARADAAVPDGLLTPGMGAAERQAVGGAYSPYDWLPTPRQPSQLYEAILEGWLVFVLLAWLALFRRALYRPGLCTGLFLALYGLGRYGVEFARQRGGASDAFMPTWISMGQLLSLPMVIAGVAFVAYALARSPVPGRGGPAAPG